MDQPQTTEQAVELARVESHIELYRHGNINLDELRKLLIGRRAAALREALLSRLVLRVHLEPPMPPMPDEHLDSITSDPIDRLAPDVVHITPRQTVTLEELGHRVKRLAKDADELDAQVKRLP